MSYPASQTSRNCKTGLTCRLVWDERLVVKAKNLSDVVEIWMLSNKRPLCIVHLVVEIGDGHFHSPILLVIELHMPMHTNWAHVLCALYDFGILAR